MKDPNDYIGSVFVWDKEKVNGIMQDIVNFTKQSDNNIKDWRNYETIKNNDNSICCGHARRA